MLQTQSNYGSKGQNSFRSRLKTVVARDPLLLGWTRRAYVALGFGDKNETDYLFDIVQTQKDIFVLQVGANDGRRHDPLNPFLHTYPWRGLLLEPLPDIFAELRSNYAGRQNVTLVNAALADRDGEMTFYRVRADDGVPDNCHELGSFYKDIVAGQKSVFWDIERHVVAVTVQAVSFPTILREQNVQKIDVVVIDTEGYDFEVLKLIEIERFRPRLILYEHMHLSEDDQHAADAMLTGLGYEVHPMRRVNCNTAAVYRAH